MWSLSLDEDFQWRLKDIHKNFSMSALAISFLLKVGSPNQMHIGLSKSNFID